MTALVQALSLIEELDALVEKRLVTRNKHPLANLYIYNYTSKCQFDRHWTPVTRQARGLIVNGAGEIVARPFEKFFNLGDPEVGPLPEEPFEVYEKVDGCFTHNTLLQCWDGSMIRIGDVVRKDLRPTLMGLSQSGEVVPCEVLEGFRNGMKDDWLAITVDCLVSKRSGMGRHSNTIRVTPNHHILLNGEYKAAREARPQDEVTTFAYNPSASVLHLIEAGLLGDGSLSRNGRHYRYQESHKSDHHEYVELVREWLGECSIDSRSTLSGYGTRMEWANSKSYEALTTLRRKWYPEGVKVVPSDLSWLDDFAVAKWYMDDGALTHSEGQQDRATFSTNGFDLDSTKRLASCLEGLYSVDVTVFNSKGWTLRVNAGRDGAIERLWTAIAPHVVPCMRYKLPAKYRSAPVCVRERGQQSLSPQTARVISVERLESSKRNFPNGRTGFDIKTTTGNYFAKGILVHNSLGILYWIDNEPLLATRGSFISEQALRGSQILRQRYPGAAGVLNPLLTYLVEIVYPENRIVVDYGNEEDIILLAVIETATGDELPLSLVEGCPLPMARRYRGVDSIEDLKTLGGRINAEGYVVRFQSGLRVKVKFDWYLRLHRLVTGITEKRIWECLRNGDSLDIFLIGTPEEFHDWVSSHVDALRGKYREYLRTAEQVVSAVSSEGLTSRKEIAAFIHGQVSRGIHSICFALLDGKPVESIIWRLCRPEESTTFKVEF